MTKQRLEKTLQEILKHVSKSYYMKIQVNPMAHTRTPGDFLFVTHSRNYIIECKECASTNRFDFSRYTQRFELNKWTESVWRNRGLLLISFWGGKKKTSLYFLLTEKQIRDLIDNSTKKSANYNDLKEFEISYNDLEELKWM